MEEHSEKYLLPFEKGVGQATIAAGSHIDLAAVFGREAPIVVEVGPGSGEQLVHAATLHPEWDFLAFEAWAPGVARCVNAVSRAELDNVKIAELDAAQALPIIFGAHLGSESSATHAAEQVTAHVAEQALAHAIERDGAHDVVQNAGQRQYASQVWTFFPDPWRKKKHRKRRIVSPSFAHTVAAILQPDGVWRMATDWDNYAWQMRDVIAESPWFRNPYAGQNIDFTDEGIYQGGFAPRFEERVMTRFEERGLEAQRKVHDVVAVRNNLGIDDAEVPEDPWVSAVARGETVLADRGGERPASSRRGLAQLG
ncbi:tRNA (guanine-N7)-methyltransferase [Arcanobacterium bovis]|uniref:tRNA (guanine-N(7)-)-methyltransferase n=2 Tax=Arcanobacterium bovis TaxID=2529275 RepID=A0A4Q9V0U2_9ACTO|nr:tRNA (guanine-N7)-methyltransferase [Arcanobacterium bovis]